MTRSMGIRGVVLLAVSAGAFVFASAANAAVVGSKPIAGWQANNTVRVRGR